MYGNAGKVFVCMYVCVCVWERERERERERGGEEAIDNTRYIILSAGWQA